MLFSAEDDAEFEAVDQDDDDDEETLAEQEKNEADKVDHKEEIEHLAKEGLFFQVHLRIVALE